MLGARVRVRARVGLGLDGEVHAQCLDRGTIAMVR